MKRTRKPLAVLLSLLLALSVCAVAFAADGVTVTFLDPDGSALAPAQTVAAGAVPAIPADPVKEDCFFKGWKLPDEYKYYDFVTPLDEDTALTAVWEEGVGFFRDDFQNGLGGFTNDANAWTLESEGGNRFARFSGGAATGYLATPVFDVSAVKDGSPRYMYVEFNYRNPATQTPDEPGGNDGHSDVFVEYRFANTDAEGTWRTDDTVGATYTAHDGWTRYSVMLFFYPQYYSYVDLQFGFVSDGEAGVFDLDDVNIYYGGHDFDFKFGYDEDTDETLFNEIHASCDNGFCALDPDEEILVKINAPEKKYTDDDKSPAATLTGLDALKFYTGKSVPEEISYVSLEDESADLPDAPTDPGFYSARVFIWNADIGIEYPYMELHYAIGYTLTYGATLADITLPNENYVWADGVQTDEVLGVGEYTFDVDKITSYDYYDWETEEYKTGYYVQTFTLPVRVLPKTLAVTAKSAEKYEGDTDPALEYEFDESQLVGTDKLTGALARDTGETAGTYAITQGTLSAGDNYTIDFTGATFTVKAKQTPPEEPTDPPEDPTNPPEDPTNPPEEPTDPPEEPTNPPEEPTTNPSEDPGSKGSFIEKIKNFFCKLKEELCEFLTYPFRLIAAAFSDIDINVEC